VNAAVPSRPHTASRRSRRSRRGRLIAAGALAATALLPATVAEAQSPRHVDPALMVPTLNPSFAPWSCWEAGNGITCQGRVQASYTNEPLGLQCGGQDVYLTGREDSRMTRWHTADGLATKTVIHSNFPADTFSLSSDGDGAGLTISGHFNRHYVYAVPGDLGSRTLTEVGAIYLGRTPEGGPLVLQDTGRVTFAPGADFEVITSSSGVHEAYSDPAAIDRIICDALT
jgi:hypothetical protein